jgi:hypothetical protein
MERRPILACASDIGCECHHRLLIETISSQGTLSSLDLSDLGGTCRSVGCVAGVDGGPNYVHVPSAEIRKDLEV